LLMSRCVQIQMSVIFVLQLIFAFSVLGLLFYGYFFSFHLLHIAEFNQLLKRTIRAITQNGRSRPSTGIIA